VTSSQDSTVKFWNIMETSGKADHIIKIAQAPVWKVRYTPFGEGFVTLVMHTLLRGENNLMLWDRNDLRSPVHTFYGHSDMVLEFAWRKKPDTSKYQLVTWSKDLTLRLWSIDADLQRQVGHEVEDTEERVDEDEDIMVTEGASSQIDEMSEDLGVVDAVEMSENGDTFMFCDVPEEDVPVVISSPVINSVINSQPLRRTNSLLGEICFRCGPWRR